MHNEKYVGSEMYVYIYTYITDLHQNVSKQKYILFFLRTASHMISGQNQPKWTPDKFTTATNFGTLIQAQYQRQDEDGENG